MEVSTRDAAHRCSTTQIGHETNTSPVAVVNPGSGWTAVGSCGPKLLRNRRVAWGTAHSLARKCGKQDKFWFQPDLPVWRLGVADEPNLRPRSCGLAEFDPLPVARPICLLLGLLVDCWELPHQTARSLRRSALGNAALRVPAPAQSRSGTPLPPPDGSAALANQTAASN